MADAWSIGDRVTPNPKTAWVHEGTEFEAIMSQPRSGTVVAVPWATHHTGRGTLRVRWESMTPQPLKRPETWTHTDLVMRAPCPAPGDNHTHHRRPHHAP